MKKIVIVLLCFLCFACEKKNVNVFKEEFMKYNGDYLELSIDSDVFQVSSVDEVNKKLKNGTFVLLVGNSRDNVSRKVVEILLSVAENTGLDKIYYVDTLDGIDGLDEIENLDMPLVLFVLEGKIVAYRVGTFDNRYELSEDEVLELYNIYSNGAHMVLKDTCEDECSE